MIVETLWIGVCLLAAVAVLEVFWPQVLREGFETVGGAVGLADSAFWAKWVPRRGDVGPDPAQEEGGYIRDPRYFAGYTDVQRLGANQDFCRMIVSKADKEDIFFACALGGTEGLSTTRYRTKSKKQGFQLSRDDYMNELGDGREGYCRILKVDANTFEPRCNQAMDEGFRDKLVIDPNPPADIQEMLVFYEGIVFWLRFRDDMVDYAKNLTITTAGHLTIDEAPPNPAIARTLEFNGVDQFLRIGDNKDLEFGNTVDLRYLRSICFWVYFDEFTNNAHIIDFGNGAGKDNVLIGIIGRGNAGPSARERTPFCGSVEGNTLPCPPSGAQSVEIQTPQELMETTPANVNDFVCPQPEIIGRTMPPVQPKSTPPSKDAKTADLMYEIWDTQQRKVHVKLRNAVPLQKWAHICITATSMDAARPDLAFYINGKEVHREPGAWLPQDTYTTRNYIGKSNWSSATTPYENADELFKGKLFDLRGYQTPMNDAKIKDTYTWGSKLLGL